MIAIPKIVLIAVMIAAAWMAMRWFNRPATTTVRRQPAAGPRRGAAIEDLTACRICGAYVVLGARGCGKTGCPLPP